MRQPQPRSFPPPGTRPGARPLRDLADADLLAACAAAIAGADGEAGAHCIHELWMRDALGVDIDALLERLWRAAGASVPEWLPTQHVDWLPRAYDVAARFAGGGRGRYNLYLVLLDYRDRRDGPFGLYVGMSHYPPAQRFDQHKAGIRAAGSVLKRGLEVLTGPVLHLQRIRRADAASIEVELAGALREAGLLVQGGH